MDLSFTTFTSFIGQRCDTFFVRVTRSYETKRKWAKFYSKINLFQSSKFYSKMLKIH